jgi:hypothetical protein
MSTVVMGIDPFAWHEPEMIARFSTLRKHAFMSNIISDACRDKSSPRES